jgi:hypothetical protein
VQDVLAAIQVALAEMQSLLSMSQGPEQVKLINHASSGLQTMVEILASPQHLNPPKPALLFRDYQALALSQQVSEILIDLSQYNQLAANSKSLLSILRACEAIKNISTTLHAADFVPETRCNASEPTAQP